jgi:putative restriction endonuclease
MPISFDRLEKGVAYDRPTLARLWGYKSWRAFGKGVFTPRGEQLILLFITEQKQEALPQYRDMFDGEVLKIEGELGHGSDERIIQAKQSGDKIHVFHRKRHHEPFTYEGEFDVESYTLHSNRPSQFTLRRITYKSLAKAAF